jgi:hypothetical protein
MAVRSQNPFTTVRTEGGVLPIDLLQRIAEGDARLGGLAADDYHLAGEKINEAVSRSWQRLRGAWAAFRSAAEKSPENDLGTSLTREKWLLPLFQELGYGRLLTSRAIEVEGDSYPVSHLWHHTPIHILGFRIDLDRRSAGVAGAARMSPHGMVQELLNRSEGHLWGFLSNGYRLRILRDSVSIARATYVEWDLEAMMEGDVYSDFVLLWLLCHQSRVEAPKAEESWLERWTKAAQEQGTRVLENLRDGVERAINALGGGYLAHPANRTLKDRLRSGELDGQEFYRQLLQQVYRLLFLFVAEDRGLLLSPDAHADARRRFEFYSTTKLRRLAERRTGTRHGDLVHALRLVLQKLGEPDGCPELGLPALGSFLFSPGAASVLEELEIANHHLLDAVRALAFTQDRHSLRPVDFRNLGSRELGSVYESLLELHPALNVDAGTFQLETAGGNERKTTGSYYTPEPLIQALLDSALDPVLEVAAGAADPERAILDLKVCDPACGSGHFLISAAHRIAKTLAQVRSPDEEPSPAALRHALRDVIGHCLYGVDLNPMAVELCKVSLWMEALEPGRPLSFLDHRIQVGNSLLGATPALLRQGIPDDAFKPIEGDDKAWVSSAKRVNREERNSHRLELSEPWERLGDLAYSLSVLDALPDDTLGDVAEKQRRYDELVRSEGYLFGRLWADAWCAAFVWKKTKDAGTPLTEDQFRRIEKNPLHVPSWMREEIQRLAAQYQFFHWHLAYPDVFQVSAKPEAKGNDPTGWMGGFDVVLGNPPWEGLQSDPQEFFANSLPAISAASNKTVRNRMIEALRSTHPELYGSWLRKVRNNDSIRHLINSSGRFPLTSYGRLNTYSLFAETAVQLVHGGGRWGMVLPVGIATDAFNQHFFREIVQRRRLVSLFGFENEAFVFPGIHHAFKFCLLTCKGDNNPSSPTLSFYLRSADDLRDESRTYRLTSEDFRLINPNTITCPVFRTQRDAELTASIYRRFPVILDEPGKSNPWGVICQLMFMMGDVSSITRSGEDLRVSSPTDEVPSGFLPLYEAKMFHQYDHRFGTYYGQSQSQKNQGKLPESTAREHCDPCYRTLPQYWVPRDAVMESSKQLTSRQWLLSWRDVTSSVVTRTAISAVLPMAATNDSAPLAHFPDRGANEVALFLANFNAFVFDFVTRQKIGGNHLRFFTFYQLPIVPPDAYYRKEHWCGGALSDYLLPLVLELTYTAWDLQPFAKDCGYNGPPFRWDESRRFLLRCELDAAFFHLYGIERDDVDYIMETFPIVKRKDEAAFGEYRTKRMILDIYDGMADAARNLTAYQTRLDPAPADPQVAHSIGTETDSLQDQSPRTFEFPEVPAWMPTDDPYEVPTVVWALLHAAGGSLSRLDLARAFVLRSRSDSMVKYASPELAPTARKWAERVGMRTVEDGALSGAIRGLIQRRGIALSVDSEGRPQLTTTEHTRPESQIGEWYRFEAHLALAVLRGSSLSAKQAIGETLSGSDRELLQAGAA